LFLGTEFLHTVIYGRHDYKPSEYDTIKISPIPLGPDCQVFLYAAFVCFIFNWAMRKVMIEPWARVYLHHPTSKRVQKFAQATMEMLFYGVFFYFGYCVFFLGCKEWRWPSSQWWEGKDEGAHNRITPDIRFYIICYAARYLSGLVSVMMEHRRTDFFEMVAHHAVTVVLIILAYAWGYYRISCVIMWLLDCADPPLHLAKQLKYFSRSKIDWYQFAADRVFEFFGVSFFVTRAGFYSYVCWSTCFEKTKITANPPGDIVMIGLVLVLLGLNYYWVGLLFKAVHHMITTGGIDDLRSDDEDDVIDTPNAGQKKQA